MIICNQGFQWMKNFRQSATFLLFFLSLLICQGQLTIADLNKSDYRIIIPANPQPDEIKAAGELQKYLEKISGVSIPIIPDDQEPATYEIIIGNSCRLNQFKVKAAFNDFENDGFLILTKKEQLFIVGGSP